MKLSYSWDLVQAFIPNPRLQNAAGIWLDYRLSLLSKRVFVRHLPPAVMIEPTNICNLKCPLCPSGNGSLSRPRGMMKLEAFREIVDQLHSHIGMLILWNQGEPYLNPDFNQMVNYAAAKQLYTMCSTNFSLALDLEGIINSGLNKLIISMDGISPETYDQYRVNGNYELVLSNMHNLVKMKRQMRKRTPEIVWQFIVMRQNEHEIDRVKQKAREIGVDKLEFKTVQIYNEEDIRFLPSNHQYSRYFAEGKTFELKTALLNRCRRLWTQPVINWDGELSICCYDKDLTFKIGNVLEHGFAPLWYSARMNKMRRSILHNRAQFEICRNCGEGIIQKIKL